MQHFDPLAADRESSISGIPAVSAVPGVPAADVPRCEAGEARQVREADGDHDETGPTDCSRLIACLQAWSQHRRGRFHYRLRCATGPAQLPTVEQLGARLAEVSPPLPPSWAAALLRGWPPPLRGLHRIELVADAAWVSVAIDLKPVVQRRLEAQSRAIREAHTHKAHTHEGNTHEGNTPRDAVVVGAGLAGCAMADAFLRRGFKVTVIEGSDHTGGAVADLPLLAQHPALSPGGDRRSRLLLAALLTTWRLGDRLGRAMDWCGRFQPMAEAEARLRTAGIPAGIAQPIGVSDPALHGVAGLSGIWYPCCAMVRPQRWWRQVLQYPGIDLRLSQPVAAVVRRGGRWQAVDAGGAAIASAAVMVLACQAQALSLAAMPTVASGRLRRSRIQVAIGSATPAANLDSRSRRSTVLGGSSYRLEDCGRHCVIGPLQPGQDSLLHNAVDLPGLTINDPRYRWRLSEPAERLLLRDNLPMIGPAPDVCAILAGREAHARNDRLPLPRQEALHLLTGLGGRGLLWSVLGAEMIAAAVNGEPALVPPDLQEAVDPARFLKRALRGAPGTVHQDLPLD